MIMLVTLLIPSMQDASASCRLNITPSDSDDVGKLEKNNISLEYSYILENQGNQDLSLSIRATHWLNVNDTSQEILPRDATHYSFTEGESYADKDAFERRNNDIKIIPAGSQVTLYLQVQATVDAMYSDFLGTVYQTLDIIRVCV